MIRLLLPLLVIASIAPGCAAPDKTVPTALTTETVLLLPGLGRTHRAMSRLQSCLIRQGFDARDWNYSSTQGRIEDHARELQHTLILLDRDPSVARIHLVGHSLGAIIIRRALTMAVPVKIGRVVMLAPPNRGSKSADRWSTLFGQKAPVLDELSDEPDSVVNQMRVPDGVEIGIIAAAYDLRVDERNTHLPGETDHITLRALHGSIMWQSDTCRHTAHFLRHARFALQSKPDSKPDPTSEPQP